MRSHEGRGQRDHRRIIGKKICLVATALGVRKLSLFASCGSLILLGACSSTINLSVPTNKAEDFGKCVANPALTWQYDPAKNPSPAIATSAIGGVTIRSIVDYAVEARGVKPIRTAPSKKTFRNIYASAEVAAAGGTPTAADNSSAAAVDRVGAILGGEVQQKLIAIYNGLSGTTDDSSISIDTSELKSYLDSVRNSTQLGDWSVHANSAVKSYQAAVSAAGAAAATNPDVANSLTDMTTAIYIVAYLKAYFRSGEFVQGKIDITSLVDTIPALKSLSTADQASINSLLQKVNLQFGKIATAGFVARGGETLQFPTVNFSVSAAASAAPAGTVTIVYDPTKNQASISKIDYTQIGGDLIRVLLEAIFDSQDQLPAVSNATGVNFAVDQNSADVSTAIHLPDYTKIKARSPYGLPNTSQFGDIDTFASQVDGASAVAVGQILRGIGPAALNNEALATVIEATVGASVHKVGEKLGWCWYAVAGETAPAATSSAVGVSAAESSAGLTTASDFLKMQQRTAPVGGVRTMSVKISY